MAPRRTVQAIYDTQEGVVHIPELTRYQWVGLENTEEFVAWLNAKANKPRFTVVTATPIVTSAKGGMAARYHQYLNGEPAVRIRAALNRIIAQHSMYHQPRLALIYHGGCWTVPEATVTIASIAEAARVPFDDARQALLDYLRGELGDVMDRVVFPLAHTAASETGPTDTGDIGDEAYPVEL